MTNLPSKKIILLVAGITLAGSALYILYRSGRQETYVAPVITASSTESAFLTKDTDRDGLKDWEEELWKTDSANADTDGDGTLDGDEIKAGRDPLVRGPNDKLDTDTIERKINTETEKDLSETDRFSRELFLKIIAARKDGAIPSEEDFRRFLDETIQKEVAGGHAVRWSAGDFQVDTAETFETVRAYADAVVRILTTKPAEPLEYELAVVDRATTKNAPEELKKLDPLLAQYKKMEAELKTLVVPKSAVVRHVSLAQSISDMHWSIAGLRLILIDPVKALPGVSAYGENTEAFFKSIRDFRPYLEEHGVVFEEESNGYKLFNGI